MSAGCAQKQEAVPTSGSKDPPRDIAREYVCALSAKDTEEVIRLSPPFKNISLATQTNITFRLTAPDGSRTPLPSKVVVDESCSALSSQDYSAVVSESQDGGFTGAPSSLEAMRQYLLQFYRFQEVDFFVLSVHETENPQKKYLAYVTIFTDYRGDRCAAPGIGGF